MKEAESSLHNKTLMDYNDAVTKALSLLSNSYNFLIKGSIYKQKLFLYKE